MTANGDSEETHAPIGRLSEAQRACLRLVNEHKTSKEIALLLGISRFTVDQRIERACRILGVEGRGKAAFLLAQHERAEAPEQFVYEPVDIADAAPVEPPMEPLAGAGPIGPSHVAQGQAAYRPAPGNRRSIWQALVPRGNADDLTTAARIKWIAQLTVQIVVAVLLLLAIAQGGSAVVERIWPAHTLTTN